MNYKHQAFYSVRVQYIVLVVTHVTLLVQLKYH